MPPEKTAPPADEASKTSAKETPQDQLSITHHHITLGGRDLHYTVTAGTIVLKEEVEAAGEKKPDETYGEKPKAAVFFVAYTLDPAEGEDLAAFRARRPLTFSFNGGPGSSSVWLHLGLLGPRRVAMDPDGNPLPPPYHLVDNEYSLLDATDLVFIDPVSTGFSRAVPGENPRDYHGFKKDVQSVGDFIRLYTSRNLRWSSPKFLIGESYGTTRAGGLSGYLQERHGMYLNGIMLVSAILNFLADRFDPGNDLPCQLFLPTYAATAWYHKRLPARLQADLRQTLAEVEEFALNDYALALLQGDNLSGDRRDQIVRRLAQYTGLSPAYIEQTNLRINIFRFVKELLRDEHRTVGRLDSRFKGVDRDAAGENCEHDPSLSAIIGPYTATLNDYVRSELQYESDLPYEILTERVHPWSYSDYENQYVNVTETLRSAMSINPFLKVFVANGFYDFATPYFATVYTFNHLGLDPTLRDHVQMGFYEAGHMMYIHLPSLAQLKQDLEQFIRSAIQS